MSRLPAILLSPIVLIQGAALRRRTPRMAPATPRSGGSRAPDAVRLLVLGDSTAVGTGVDQMADAVAGQVARGLAEPVAWRVVGENGLRSDQVLTDHLASALAQPADLIVVLVGWNDALQLRPAGAFGRNLAALLEALRTANPGARIVVVAPPRFGRFGVLPPPLRTVLGAHAAGLTRAADRVARAHGAALVDGFDGGDVASDRFHPDATGYAAIAERVVAAFP